MRRLGALLPHRLHTLAAWRTACRPVHEPMPCVSQNTTTAVAVHTTNALLRDAGRRRALGKA